MYKLSELNAFIEKGFLSIKFNEPPKELYEPIEYMLSIGGKRLRPMTCLMTYNLFSNSIDKAVLFPAMALEVFHAFTLIHDDIMDNASVRRGRPTVHSKWNANTAILSGDVMSIKAYELLSHTNPLLLQPVLQLFIKTAIEVCEGQQYDMNYENLPFITMTDYIKMIELKTAVLIACSAKMGALIAGADKKVCDMLYDYAYNLGIAFQIMDDYLDSFGDSAVFGKKIGGDILNNKKTWLLVETLRVAKGEDKDILNSILLMKDEELEKIGLMQRLYTKLEIDKRALSAVQEYGNKAMNLVENSNLNEAQKDQLRYYAQVLMNRDK